ncbi:MAG TPA: TetR/AcrR family transcriptional regulator [Acidimicrobiales bacterium]|nr:TetR/AcrR family transcriptional regulator [Acidimicrobiales bacterium]
MAYHHGNLRQALVDAAVTLARSGGPDAVVLRAATREAGVTPNAAYRHFADRDDLLGAVCQEAMEQLASRMQASLAEIDDDGSPLAAWARLRATGRAYVEFALAEPGLFRTAFTSLAEAHSGLPPGEGRIRMQPFEILAACLDGLVASGGLPPERRAMAETAAWAAVHGISELLLYGPLRQLGPEERERAIDKVLDTVAFGL